MTSTFLQLTDLASERLGGRVLFANDEFFAPKENLIKPGRGVSIEDRYTDRGKWMDGWETRRRRQPGHDWCILALAGPGVVHGVVIDTNHFKGNHPESASLDGCLFTGPLESERNAAALPWREILPGQKLRGHSENPFEIAGGPCVSHLRLNIYPDGGVARLRVHGEAKPDWPGLIGSGGPIDLVAAVNGGLAMSCSDEFFSAPGHLLLPGRALNMGDGWETRRRRGPGYDWCIIRLATRGVIETVEIDTNHFKGNYPDRFSLEAADVPGAADLERGDSFNALLVPETKLDAHAVRRITVARAAPCTFVRLNIYPDGGVSRLRLWGRPLGNLDRLNALDPVAARAELLRCCSSGRWADAMVASRPFAGFDDVARAAERAWSALARADRLEAFAGHPRLGGDVRREGTAATAAWSSAEQAGLAGAAPDEQRRLAEGNAAYEKRFGFVFLLCATGRSGPQMLEQLERRLGNDDGTELEIASQEQQRIMLLRLAKLLFS